MALPLNALAFVTQGLSRSSCHYNFVRELSKQCRMGRYTQHSSVIFHIILILSGLAVLKYVALRQAAVEM